jgi:hypothetical protein
MQEVVIERQVACTVDANASVEVPYPYIQDKIKYTKFQLIWRFVYWFQTVDLDIKQEVCSYAYILSLFQLFEALDMLIDEPNMFVGYKFDKLKVFADNDSVLRFICEVMPL